MSLIPKRKETKMNNSKPNRHGEYIWTTVGKVRVIPEENRTIKAPWVANLSANWDPLKQGSLYLSDRGDGLPPFVMIGQHRTLAARNKFGPNYYFHAILYRGLTRAEEREIWLGHDDETRGASSLDKFRMKYEAGRPEAVDITKILEAHDMSMGNGHGSRAVRCPEAVAQAFRRGTLDRLLGICEQAWPTQLDRALQFALVSGLSLFLVRFPDADVPGFVKRLAKETPDSLVAMGHAQTYAASVAAGVSAVLVEIYNKGRRSGRLS
jgi:hypothetical protein